MFETLRRHPLKVFSQVAQDPLDAFFAFQGELLSRFEGQYTSEYDVDPNWESGDRHLARHPRGLCRGRNFRRCGTTSLNRCGRAASRWAR